MLLDFSQVVTPKKVYVKRPASKSPVKKKKRGKRGPTEANPTKLSNPVDEESQDKPRELVHVEFDVKPMYQSREPSMNGYVEGQYIPVDDDPHLVPLEELFSTSPCPDLYSTPAPIVPLVMVVVPSSAIVESLVWRLKHLLRNMRVLERLLDFEHGFIQSEYVLTEEDKEILEGFHRYYIQRYQPPTMFSV
ncbi:hypothetical protein MRB53_015502 [Persea americana]|uniref:Uncharacterized protein n=1 Tax=Persea americana TaxID=3435 RepID=A0ACC2M038_PERAE|nr:hypothetical protein MRB53_015502 [Persea americana]